MYIIFSFDQTVLKFEIKSLNSDAPMLIKNIVPGFDEKTIFIFDLNPLKIDSPLTVKSLSPAKCLSVSIKSSKLSTRFF